MLKELLVGLFQKKKQAPSADEIAKRREHLQSLALQLGFSDARIFGTTYGPNLETDGGRMKIEVNRDQFCRFLETKKPATIRVKGGFNDDVGERCTMCVEIEPNTDLDCSDYAHMHFDAGVLDKLPYKPTTEKRGPLGNVVETTYERQE